MLLSQERMMNLDLRRSAELLRVLAHPTRLAILGALKDGLKCVSDINELLDVSQPNLSQHLAVLRRERIVDFYEKGKQRCYYITRPSMVQALILFLAGEYPVVVPAGESACCVTKATQGDKGTK
jgi:ArsR family transcriptional regulator